jgi:hypothetical protein
VKITKTELRAIRDGRGKEAAILRLAAIVERSSLPRSALAKLFAGACLEAHGYEDAAREGLFRLLSLVEAMLSGEVLELEAEPVEAENDDDPLLTRLAKILGDEPE